MFPKSYIDKTQCLESLVGIRTQCAVGEDHPFWIEDIPGFDVSKLAKMAKSSNPSGKDLGRQLINQAARTMMANLETLLTDGYAIRNTYADICSANEFTPVFTQNAGIVIKPAVPTNFGVARLHRLSILTNVTGTRTISIDDGTGDIRMVEVDLEANTLMPVNLEYKTTQKSFKVKFTDPTVGVAQIKQATTSGCGCGSSGKTVSPINVTGLLGTTETTTQYGFLPCVSVDCSYDVLVCDLINRLPNIFGLAMLNKVGELAFESNLIADRNNDAVSFNQEPEKEMPNVYARRYWASLKGSKDMEGINKKINAYLSTQRTDKCIICETKVKVSYVTG